MIADLIDNQKNIQYKDRGSYGKVFTATSKDQTIAVKVLKKTFFNEQELTTLSKVSGANSPFIIKFINFKNFGDEVYFFMEYAEKGNLKDYFQSGTTKTEKDAAFMLFQLLHGLKTIQDCQIMHRDLKPENLMLQKVAGTDKLLLKITDFGVSRTIDKSGLAQTFVG
ncbi:MAG: hypothetical protein EZS28_039339, partial [Streblomastix strix]